MRGAEFFLVLPLILLLPGSAGASTNADTSPASADSTALLWSASVSWPEWMNKQLPVETDLPDIVPTVVVEVDQYDGSGRVFPIVGVYVSRLLTLCTPAKPKPAGARESLPLIDMRTYYSRVDIRPDGSVASIARAVPFDSLDASALSGLLPGVAFPSSGETAEAAPRLLRHLTCSKPVEERVSYYDTSDPRAPRLLWERRFPGKVMDACAISPDGKLVAMQVSEYLQGAAQSLVVLREGGEIALAVDHPQAHGDDLGLTFLDDQVLLEGVGEVQTNWTRHLSIYEVR